MASFLFTLFLSLVTLLGMCARIDAVFTCPSIDWVRHQGNCYRVYSGHKTFEEAETFCNGKDALAHLVSIHSTIENAVVYALFSCMSSDTNKRMWIGLNKPTGSTEFEWSDATTVDYTLSWAANQPGAAPAPSAVVMIPGNGASLSEWEVSTNNHQDYFMCKTPAQ